MRCKNVVLCAQVTSDAVNFSLGPAVIHNLTLFSFSTESSSFMLLKIRFNLYLENIEKPWTQAQQTVTLP